jgi:hypothetical protein
MVISRKAALTHVEAAPSAPGPEIVATRPVGANVTVTPPRGPAHVAARAAASPSAAVAATSSIWTEGVTSTACATRGAGRDARPAAMPINAAAPMATAPNTAVPQREGAGATAL